MFQCAFTYNKRIVSFQQCLTFHTQQISIHKWNIKISTMNADNTGDCCAAMVQTQIGDKLQQ